MVPTPPPSGQLPASRQPPLASNAGRDAEHSEKGRGLSKRLVSVRPSGAGSISDLPNLGPKSTAMLARAGITELAQLRALGALAAYAKVKAVEPAASLNLLWALEGALSGLPWQQVAKEHRTSLLLSLEQWQHGG